MGAALTSGAIDPDTARDQARDILDSSRYEETELPRPFEGVLEWLGERLRPVVDAWDAFVDWVLDGPVFVRIAALTVVALTAAYVAYRVARARTGVERPTGMRGGHDDVLDPDDLERRAERAEREGDLAAALRLRFRAGLLRLDHAGVIEFRPSITSGEVARRLRLDTFSRLAARHDEVAYGGRPASLDDLADARSTWPRLVKP